jgi:hypothetical protein
MDKDRNEERLLRYLVRDNRETAPEGFTDKVMTRVTLERVSRATRYESPVKPATAIGFVAVTVSLIILSSLLPEGSSWNIFTGKIIDTIREIKPTLPDLKLAGEPDINIPVMFVYLSVAIFLLTLLDGVLSTLFRRRRGSRH